MQRHDGNVEDLDNLSVSPPHSHPRSQIIDVLTRDNTSAFCNQQRNLKGGDQIPVLRWSQSSDLDNLDGTRKITIIDNTIVTTTAIDSLCESITEYVKRRINKLTVKNLYEYLPDYIDYLNNDGKNSKLLMNTLYNKDEATGEYNIICYFMNY